MRTSSPAIKRPAEHDKKASDGFVFHGWRKVCYPGYVRFGCSKHYHCRLQEWVNQWVFVEVADWLVIDAVVHVGLPWTDPFNKIECINETDRRAILGEDS